ncbi:HAD superfamily hydrolase (TIGR01549 family) [Halanaerobium sp. DL-01]|uniref:HAD family hydrolase n=1 Tax=Halanaerobium sp. DL-01 TaxID=1653064 RepID=UPI000DF18E2F|nr:HAD family hydrolase [Halanaerobium sp. DL-01]RCW85707.1 HAD superfamily hydrolase (TIGR01549 family) [Halanaerobium sp. DL-01]
MLAEKRTFLFDLDGTLLTIELDKFLKLYFNALAEEFSNITSSRDEFIKILMSSTEKMIKNSGEKSNQEVFMKNFFEKIKTGNRDKIISQFNNFYKNIFPELKKQLDIDDSTPPQIINYLKSRNKRLVLATNPIFPREAVVERLRWAGLKEGDFDFISSYENMESAKPNPKYFVDLLNKIGEKADKTVMIGNDIQEDMAAAEVGITTYIIEDYIIDRGSSTGNPDWRGSLKEFLEMLKKEL